MKTGQLIDDWRQVSGDEGVYIVLQFELNDMQAVAVPLFPQIQLLTAEHYVYVEIDEQVYSTHLLLVTTHLGDA